MIVTKDEFNALLAGESTAIGFCLTLKVGSINTVEQCFIVENDDPVTEIGRMNGYGIALLASNGLINEDQAAAFRMAWRKIIKS